jgi:hypothetical protein
MRAEAAGLSLQSPRASPRHGRGGTEELGLRLPQQQHSMATGDTPIRGGVSGDVGGFFSPRRLWNAPPSHGGNGDWSPPRGSTQQGETEKEPQQQGYAVVGSDYVRQPQARDGSASNRRHGGRSGVTSPTITATQQAAHSPTPLQPPPPYKPQQHKAKRVSPSIPRPPSSRVQRNPSPNRSALSSSPPYSSSSGSPPQERDVSPPQPLAAAAPQFADARRNIGPTVRRLMSPTITSVRDDPAVQQQQQQREQHDASLTPPVLRSGRTTVPPPVPSPGALRSSSAAAAHLITEAATDINSDGGNVRLRPPPTTTTTPHAAASGLDEGGDHYTGNSQTQHVAPRGEEHPQIRTAPHLEVISSRSQSPSYQQPHSNHRQPPSSGPNATVSQVLALDVPSSSSVNATTLTQPPPPLTTDINEGRELCNKQEPRGVAESSHRVVTPISLSANQSVTRRAGEPEASDPNNGANKHSNTSPARPDKEASAQHEAAVVVVGATDSNLFAPPPQVATTSPASVPQSNDISFQPETSSLAAAAAAASSTSAVVAPAGGAAGTARSNANKKPCPFCSIDLRDPSNEVVASLCPASPTPGQTHDVILSDLKIVKAHKKHIQAAVKSGDMETGQRLLEQLQDTYGAYLA